MQKWIVGVFLGLSLSNPATSAAQTDQQNAVLVEVQHLPGCAGLDCPPWPTPPAIIFCFQAGDAYFTAESRTVPWAMSTEKLAAMKGKSVEIVVTKKAVQVTASGVTFHLRRTHHISFSSISCTQT